jgi:NAD+ kinase
MNMGSLGFLCPFDFKEYKEYVKTILRGDVPLLLRNRLRCTHSLADSSDDSFSVCEHSNQPSFSLNEIVIGRGPSPFLSNLDLWINDYLITTVQGDGIIISTPTGSTAYAMAAGASMSHPSVPSIIITPICPHSLSFRPIVVPATVDLKITLAKDARNTAWFCVDGRANTELKHGYQINITTSEYPLPSICRSDQVFVFPNF